MTCYCIKCKRHTNSVGEHNVVAQNGRMMAKSRCSNCKSGKCRMLPGSCLTVAKRRKGVRGGNAFTNFFTNTIPNGVRDTFSKPSSALGALSTATSFIPVAGEVLGPALGAAGLVARLAGRGARRR